MKAGLLPKPAAPAEFLAWQSGFGVVPDFALYNLTAPIPGHPVNSTVSAATLVAAGFDVPPLPGPLDPHC